MKNKTTATLRMKFEAFDPRFAAFRDQVNKELEDVQRRLAALEAVQKGRKRAEKKPSIPPLSKDAADAAIADFEKNLRK